MPGKEKKISTPSTNRRARVSRGNRRLERERKQAKRARSLEQCRGKNDEAKLKKVFGGRENAGGLVGTETA